MRLLTLSKMIVLGVGGGVAAYAYGKHQREAQRGDDDGLDRREAGEDHDREPTVIPDSLDADPADPVQGIDEVHEFHVEDLGVDAMSEVDADSDLLFAETESALDEASLALDDDSLVPDDVSHALDEEARRLEVGEIPDDRRAIEEGQTWLEALETSAAENGPAPEHGLDEAGDDEDVNPAHASDPRDIPVADRGAGGPAGI